MFYTMLCCQYMSNILIIKHGSLGDIAQACGAIQDISGIIKKTRFIY